MPTKVIKSAKCARYLIKRGFNVIDVKANKDNEIMTVFVFEATDNFLSALSEYSKK